MILIYQQSNGRCPFQEWLHRLSDIKGRAIIRARIERVGLGNFGDCKSIGGGIHELRISFGPGYRVYFGRDGSKFVVLLSGGDKVTQRKDISTAKLMWEEYKIASKKLPK